MSRDWLALYTNIIHKPKYRRLSIESRAALFHVWCLAGLQDPEATWSNREQLDEVLELDGYPTYVVDELTRLGWLDRDDEGRLLVHDWDHWQLAATQAARRAYERDRKQDWRRTKNEPEPEPAFLSPAPLSSDITATATAQDITTQVSPNVRDKSGTRPDCHFCRRPVSRRDLVTTSWTPEPVPAHAGCSALQRDAYHGDQLAHLSDYDREVALKQMARLGS